jgi:hypothetical protein
VDRTFDQALAGRPASGDRREGEVASVRVPVPSEAESDLFSAAAGCACHAAILLFAHGDAATTTPSVRSGS